MTTGERVHELRKYLGLTLDQFGQKIGLWKTAVSKIEHNEVGLTVSNAKLICREFHVNYLWLMEGEGEMIDRTPETLLEMMKEEYDLDDIEMEMVRLYVRMPKHKRQAIIEFMKGLKKGQGT